MDTYRVFLSGVVVGGYIDGAAMEALKKFRTKHAISESEHETTLKSLGLSKAQFHMMKRGSLGTLSAASDGNSEDHCKVCFSERIDAVMIPCGHFAICSACGKKLTECPICRQSIQKIQPIFRS